MKTWLKTGVVGAGFVLLCLMSVGCDMPWETNPGGPTTVQTVNVNVGGASPAPGASPSPGTGAIDHVKVTQFGQSCGEGGRNITVGCMKFLTCTPFFADGTLVPPAVHGPAPEFFGVIEGANFVQVTTPDEPFNRDVKGLFPGIVTFECIVKGVSSGPSEFIVVPAS